MFERICCVTAALAAAVAFTAAPAAAASGEGMPPAFATGPFAAPFSVPDTTAPAFEPGEVVVRFRDGTSAADRAEVRDAVDAELEGKVGVVVQEQLLDLAPGDDPRDVARELERRP